MAEGLLGQPPSLPETRESNRVRGPLESQGSLGGGPPLVRGKEPIQRGPPGPPDGGSVLRTRRAGGS